MIDVLDRALWLATPLVYLVGVPCWLAWKINEILKGRS